jgi:predicted Rdx family selenoprotein
VAELNGTRFTAEMVPGEESQFDVVVDGELLFSKRREGRFPEVEEILARLPPPS